MRYRYPVAVGSVMLLNKLVTPQLSDENSLYRNTFAMTKDL